VASLSSSAAELLHEDVQPAPQSTERASTQRATPPVLVDPTTVQGDAGDKTSLAGKVSLAGIKVDEVAQSWLDTQCGIISGVTCGLVLKRAVDKPTVLPIACWPREREDVSQALLDAAQEAAHAGTFVIQSQNSEAETDASVCTVAWPLPGKDGELSVAALELPDSVRQQQQAIVQLLQWGTAWYQVLRRERRPARSEDRLANVVELLASSLEHPEFDATATTAVTELAARLSCTRVSLGLLRGKRIDVCAISNSSRVDTRSNLVREIAAAMDEAVDQGVSVAFPPLPGGLPHVSFAQEVIARRGDGSSVCSTPLYNGTRTIGALTIERDGDAGFDPAAMEICEAVGALLGPVIELKHDKDRWIVFKVLESLRGFGARLFGRKHFALKLYALLLAAGIAFLSVATGDYRITAHARLEGSVKQMVTAPQDGFVASAELRAGDLVQAGQVLATLDDRELRLEKLKWRSQDEQLAKEYRAAVTAHDRSKAAILRAQKKQIGAQLALVDEQLARTRLTAPFAGIVVSGDLSQNLGSPVEHGQVLFEVAPLDSYRVILEVDERDIGDVADTQRGELTLTGLPGTTISFSVVRIVPMSTASDGRNFFEVRAELDGATSLIRPGMEGIGKIQVDRRKLAWIWSHALIDWLRLSLWTWVS